MVDMPTMHAEAIKIRRGRRTDLSALEELLKPGVSALIDKSQTRHWRRLAGDPSLDFYVAEYKGALQGALLVCYIRALQEPGWQAVLEQLTAAVQRDLYGLMEMIARQIHQERS